MMGRAGSSALFSPELLRRIRGDDANFLFEVFPELADRVPWRKLGHFPTPIEELPSIGPGVRLFAKRDDLSAPAYGGNKVRKLEHLLAAAEALGRRTLITMGGTGSNHALATAIHGRALGFDVELVLYDQPMSEHVERSLQAFRDAGAKLHFGGSLAGAFRIARRRFTQLRAEGGAPYYIMVGGTSRLGCIGHVTAGLELAAQVMRGEIPEPDYLFVPLGTGGTVAGLVAGLAVGGLGTRVAAVRVAESFISNSVVVKYLARDVVRYLHSLDPRFPKVRIGFDDFDLVPGFLGAGYGHSTPEAEAALEWAAPRLKLETTYSGKALAAALAMGSWAGTPQNVLFWNSYNSAPWPASPPSASP